MVRNRDSEVDPTESARSRFRSAVSRDWRRRDPDESLQGRARHVGRNTMTGGTLGGLVGLVMAARFSRKTALQTCTHFLSVGARTGGVAGVGSEVFYYVTDVNYMPSVNASAWGITGSCVLLINKYPFGQCLGGAALATMVSLAMSLLLEGNAIRGATRGFEKMDMQGVRPDSLQDMAQRRQFHLYKAAVSETRQFSATNTYSMVYGGTVHIDDYRDENGIVDYTKYWDAYSDAWLDWFSGIDPKAKANAPEVPDHRQAELVRRMGSLVDKHRD